MKVMKFGGTSLGKAERIKHVADLITKQPEISNIVVLSAVSGTTNSLVTICEGYKEGNLSKVKSTLEKLEEKYIKITSELFAKEENVKKAMAFVDEKLDALGRLSMDKFGGAEEKVVLAQGELISTNLMQFFLEEQGVDSYLLPALDFMKTHEGEPDTEYIREKLNKLLHTNKDHKLFITQGYICLNDEGDIDNLQRGGSDYTASLIGEAVSAKEIQIWTDIDGMHNNDPRVVDRTYPVHVLSFEEAAELAYFGAKILHPSSILPAQKANIPVKLLNTMQPEAQGTVITSEANEDKVKAVAAKDGIVAIKIKSSRMLLAYGFLRQVFGVFEKFKTPIDMITTSEVAVSLTIDKTTHLEEILTELRGFGKVEFDSNQTIICVVGQFLQNDTEIAVKVLALLNQFPIRMISYGGSKNNISILVHNDYKVKALQALNDGLFFDGK
ncbi:aspartate kinase [Flammeovirgaceae bacterium SG7u.111]|nr:aspartate kinase [Flammeovirgaceae bacterium SG7u.132]WPO33586.1 aspartate kinase [Flammeovirgaceae bacterium SG7u.111]